MTRPPTLGGGRPERLTLSNDVAVGRKFQLINKLQERRDVVVYDAMHTGIGRRVELHMLPIGLRPDGPEAARLIHAARAGARVAHRHIRSVVDSGVDAFGRPFIVYEPLDGLTAEDYVAAKGGQLEFDIGAELSCQLLEALVAAHTGGVVHRQINASNVVIAESEGNSPRLKVGGFGLAFLQHRPTHVPPLPKRYSRYYAPELRRGDQTTSPGVDIYAAGVLMRLLLTGDPRPGRPLPDVAARAIERATAEDVDERFRTAEQFLTAAAMLVATRDRPAASLHPPGHPAAAGLTADLRYLKRRRERASDVRETQVSTSDLELLPVLLLIEALYARLGDEGWGELASRMPQLVELLPDAGKTEQLAEEGVPGELVTQVLQVADEACGDGHLSSLVELGEVIARRGLRRLCPTLPERLTPQALVASVPALWRACCRSGVAEVVDHSARAARLSVRAQATPSLEITGLFAGMLRGALRTISGMDSASVHVSACQALGDVADIYALSW